jgi:hypothetical protein
MIRHEPNVAFAVGTGRCGTHFLAEVLKSEPEVSSWHERDPLMDTFHRYCRWYSLPVDPAGYLSCKRRGVETDLKTTRVSFEASAYLSFAVQDLIGEFDARVILLVRHPRSVVRSYLTKGVSSSQLVWYAEPFVQADVNLALGVQRNTAFHHFLGRIAPMGDEFARWNRLSRIGKLAWYWRAVNEHVVREFSSAQSENVMVCRLEDLDYSCYERLASFVGIKPTVNSRSFSRIAGKRPGNDPLVQPGSQWDTREEQEFEAELGDLPEEFGYVL